MAIVVTVSESMFIDNFHKAGRGDQFTRPALEALFEHLESVSDDTGEPLELDVIAICCDYIEAHMSHWYCYAGIDTDEYTTEDGEVDYDNIYEDVCCYLESEGLLIAKTDDENYLILACDC